MLAVLSVDEPVNTGDRLTLDTGDVVEIIGHAETYSEQDWIIDATIGDVWPGLT